MSSRPAGVDRQPMSHGDVNLIGLTSTAQRLLPQLGPSQSLVLEVDVGQPFLRPAAREPLPAELTEERRLVGPPHADDGRHLAGQCDRAQHPSLTQEASA